MQLESIAINRIEQSTKLYYDVKTKPMCNNQVVKSVLDHILEKRESYFIIKSVRDKCEKKRLGGKHNGC